MPYQTEVIVGIRLIKEFLGSIKTIKKNNFSRIMDLPFNPAEITNKLKISPDVGNISKLKFRIKEVEWPESRTYGVPPLPLFIMRVERETKNTKFFNALLEVLRSDPAYKECS